MLNLVSIDRGKQTSIFIISQGVRRTKSAPLPVAMLKKKQIISSLDNQDLRRTKSKSTSLCTLYKIDESFT